MPCGKPIWFNLSNGCIHVSWTNAVTRNEVLLLLVSSFSLKALVKITVKINEQVEPS